jgi:hypothetical protein
MEIARNAQQSADVASADSLEIGAAKAASAVLAQQSQRVNALEIDDNTVITYLLYYYDGRAKQITSGDATPGSNRYIKSVSEFMKHLALYEDVKDNWSYVRSNESISDQRVSPEYRPQPSVKYRFGGFRNLCIQGLNESQKRKNEVAVWAVCN